LICSDDGNTFSEPVAVAFCENHRCYDPGVWIDPLGRLWFFWAYAPDHGVYAAVCEDPDASTLIWSKEFRIGTDVMMNKPTVLSDGSWQFPIAVWKNDVRAVESQYDSVNDDRKAFVYTTVDQGKTFFKTGGVDMPQRCFDEHMILELKDGRLAMYVRTFYGIGVAYSSDGGKTWTKGEDSKLGGPNSRFFIRRLASGRVLLINHNNYQGRNNLTAMLSEDDGQTWKYRLLLDGRSNVSYPDAVEAADGYLYITYDRERGGFLKSLEEAYLSAREILIAKITEQDIIAGQLTAPESRLQWVASKLGRYALENEDPYSCN